MRASSADMLPCTSWKLSRAVLPISALSCIVSWMPGNCTSTRSRPWRTTEASAVPSWSTRRRTVSIEAVTAFAMRCCRPASVGTTVITPPSPFFISRSVTVVPRMRLPVCCTSPCSAFTAASTSSGFARRTCTALLAIPRPVKPILASRNRLRASSRTLSNQSLRTSATSIASSRCAPPLRSRPRGSCILGIHAGQACTVSLERKFGSEKSRPAKHASVTAIVFQRET